MYEGLINILIMKELTTDYKVLEYKPYDFRRKYFLNFFGGLYSIYYEDTEIMKTLWYNKAKTITDLLNKAFTLGISRSSIN